MADSKRTFTIASRASKLAQIQTNLVLSHLEAIHPPSKTESPRFQTSFTANEEGDVDKSSSLYLIGGKGLWTKGLETVLLEKKVDLLVHSFKDVPTELPEGCMIAGVIEREDPVDSLIVKQGTPYKSIEELPAGSVIGTGSVRRVAQLQRKFPKLKFEGLRGNIDTRVAKLNAPDSPYSAIILAKAGLVRSGMGEMITQSLGAPLLLHAVSQGALAIEVRSDDLESIALCEALTHQPTKYCCFAERALLRVLEGGCSVPVGVSSSLNDKTLRLQGCVTSLDGQKHVEQVIEQAVENVQDAEQLGQNLAQKLIEIGARDILDEINKDRASKTVV